MARKRIRLNLLLMFVFPLQGCTPETAPEEETAVIISFGREGMSCKAALPDEERISDINLMIIDEYGKLEYSDWFMVKGQSDNISHKVNLIKGNRYRFYACANFGYKVTVEDIGDIEDLKFHLAYPDEYRTGIPMSAQTDYVRIRNNLSVELEFIRLMSKISLRINRGLLDDDISMDVTGVRIGNCPKVMSVFEESRILDADECFGIGFSTDAAGCGKLNEVHEKNMSGAICMYMLENIQGRFPGAPLNSCRDKVFGPYDPLSEICSYIEVDIDYRSPHKWSSTSPLKYRFYLGEDLDDISIRRNSHYIFTICPEGDGLSGGGWRVDKSGLSDTGPTYLRQYPSGYIRGDIGDRIHIWCEFEPSSAPFDVGIGYMEDDKASGIYDYEITEDGKGAVLTLTGPGRGLIYMEAGAPVNDAALFIIEVNLP